MRNENYYYFSVTSVNLKDELQIIGVDKSLNKLKAKTREALHAQLENEYQAELAFIRCYYCTLDGLLSIFKTKVLEKALEDFEKQSAANPYDKRIVLAELK